MPERQGRDEFGLNFQAGEDESVEIQTNFYVVILVEATANGFVFGDFAVSRDDDLPRYRLPASERIYAREQLRRAAADDRSAIDMYGLRSIRP